MNLTSKHIATNWDKFEEFRSKKFRGLQTGFRSIDKAIIALPGLVTVMGDTGCGKSTFVLNVLMHQAQNGTPIILLDKENGLQRTRMRMLSYLSDLTPGAIEGKLYEEEVKRYGESIEQIKKLPIFYLDAIQPNGLEPLVQQALESHGKHVFIVIDSLNRIVRGGEDKRGDIDMWITLFNDLKIRYDNKLTILMICEKAKSQYGQASDRGAKDSAEIDYISELTLDLYPTKDKKSVNVECLKNRDGRKGLITCLEPNHPFTYRVRDIELLEDDT